MRTCCLAQGSRWDASREFSGEISGSRTIRARPVAPQLTGPGGEQQASPGRVAAQSTAGQTRATVPFVGDAAGCAACTPVSAGRPQRQQHQAASCGAWAGPWVCADAQASRTQRSLLCVQVHSCGASEWKSFVQRWASVPLFVLCYPHAILIPVTALLPGNPSLGLRDWPLAGHSLPGQRRRADAQSSHAGPWPRCLLRTPSVEGLPTLLEGPAPVPPHTHGAVACVPRDASPVSPDLLQGLSPSCVCEHPLSSAGGLPAPLLGLTLFQTRRWASRTLVSSPVPALSRKAPQLGLFAWSEVCPRLLGVEAESRNFRGIFVRCQYSVPTA